MTFDETFPETKNAQHVMFRIVILLDAQASYKHNWKLQ